MFGDHRGTPTGIGDSTVHFWQRSFESCQALIGRVTAAGGQAEMLDPPSRGIRGNSHMYHAGRESPADRRLHPAVDRPARRHASRREPVARAVAFAMGQPDGVDIHEIPFRPTRQEL